MYLPSQDHSLTTGNNIMHEDLSGKSFNLTSY
uniref:Uncharacterized protein n=1 Tax=Rhizophora mucronata TaxID=61149 RepID=A0A2P2QE12_RHIMU